MKNNLYTPDTPKEITSFSDEQIEKHRKIWKIESLGTHESFKQERVDFLSNAEGYNGIPRYDWENIQTGESGAQYWDSMANTESYYNLVTGESYDLIDKNKQALRDSLDESKKQKEQIIDVGVGGSGKIFDIIKKVGSFPHRYTYKGVDLSTSFLSAFEKVGDKEYGVDTDNIETSFTDWGKSINYVNSKGPIFFLGGSICNNSKEENKKIARAMCAGGGRDIWYQAFVTPEGKNKEQYIDKLEEAYTTDEMEKWIMKGCEAMNLPVDKIEFCAEYVEGKSGEEDYMRIGVKFTEDYTEEIDGKLVEKKAGDFCQVLPSIRFSREDESYLDMWEGTGAEIKNVSQSEGSVLVHVRTPEEPLVETVKPLMTKVRKKWQGLNKYVKNSLYGVLIAGAGYMGGSEVAKYQERQRHQEKVEQLEEDFFTNSQYSPYGYKQNLNQKMEYIDERERHIFALLENRYNITMTEELKDYIHYSFRDWFNSEGIQLSNRSPRQPISEDRHYYHPSIVESYLYSHRNVLVGKYNVNLAPNAHLLQYPEALRNSYEYEGKKKVFESVDEQLGDYVDDSYSSSKENKSFEFFKNRIGIKYINNKPYMVVKYFDDGYTLEPFDVNGIHYSPQSIIADIIKRGEVNLLAEQIRHYLNGKYGDGMRYVLNGQKGIVNYLTKLYAEGFDLSYLISSSQYDGVLNKKERIEAFVNSYLIKDMGESFFDEGGLWDEMYLQDSSSINKELNNEDFIDLQERSQEILSVLKQYTGKEPQGFGRSAESLIVKILLMTEGGKYLDDPWMIRCWLTDNRERFMDELGYKDYDLPKFNNLNKDPFSEDYWKNTLDSEKDIEKDLHWPAGTSHIRDRYRTIDGDVVALFIAFHGKSILSAILSDKIIVVGGDHKEYIAQQERSGAAGVSLPFTSLSLKMAKKAYKDFKKREEAWEEYQDKFHR